MCRKDNMITTFEASINYTNLQLPAIQPSIDWKGAPAPLAATREHFNAGISGRYGRVNSEGHRTTLAAVGVSCERFRLRRWWFRTFQS